MFLTQCSIFPTLILKATEKICKNLLGATWEVKEKELLTIVWSELLREGKDIKEDRGTQFIITHMVVCSLEYLGLC